jgi:hypothetical protein
MNQVWTLWEEQFVKDNAGKMSDDKGASQLSEITGRKITTYAWRKKRQNMGMRKSPGRGVCRLVNTKTQN